MNAHDLIFGRKSLRDFSEEMIPESVIQDMIEAARLAPSFQNRQCWRFIIIKDDETKKRLADKSGLVGKANFFIKKAPLIVAACADPKHSGVMNGMDYYLVDSTIAFHQMMLMARSHGIGSCWLAAFDEKKVRQILDIPDHIKVVALSPFGYPADKEKLYTKAIHLFAGSKKRLSKDKIVSFDSWSF